MPIPNTLLTDSQMESLRALAILGMQTNVTIERRAQGTIPVNGDYGDDYLNYTETSESGARTVKGWFFSTPTPVQSVDAGMTATVNTYRLFLPVGTDIQVGDRVHVENQDPTDHYTVSDTTREGTWLPLLTVSLRKRD